MCSYLKTVCESDNSLDACLVCVHDGGLGDENAKYSCVEEGSHVGQVHWNLSNSS